MSDEYIIGAIARLSVSVYNADQTLADPDVLRLKIMQPDRTIQTYLNGTADICHDGVGLFHADIALPAAGTWYYRWETDAPAAGVAEGALRVRASRFEVTA